MDLETFLEREFMGVTDSLPSDFVDGQGLDILRHFLGDRLDRLKPYTREILEQWVYDNWFDYVKYTRVSSPFMRLKGYPIYTPFEIFIDLDKLPSDTDKNDYTLSGGMACISTGYDCLIVDFSDVNFSRALQAIRPR